MPRTVTVRGTGTVSAKPDRIELTLNLSASDPDYAKAAEESGRKLEALRGAVTAAGFDKEELKTTNFNVSTEYRSVRDPETGEYRQEFAGYRIFHGTVLAFLLSLETLAVLIGGIAESGAEPEMNIRFTLADPEAFRRAALESAASDARAKAEILCAASGVRLGKLLSVQYDWNEVRFASETAFDAANGAGAPRLAKAAFAADLTPQDITLRDNAGFVWEIED